MGWSCVPRAIVDCVEHEFLEALRDILSAIIDEGRFPDVLNCTRLVVLNKTPLQTPSLKSLRPIQIYDIVKVCLEGLTVGELKRLADSDEVTGCEQFGFKSGLGTTPCILKILDTWISRHKIATKKLSLK